MAVTTTSTVNSPLTNVCRPSEAMTSRTSGIVATARAPAERSASAVRASRVPWRRPTVGTCSRAMLATLMRSMTTTAARAPAGPVVTRRTLASAGPTNVPRPSAAPEVTLAPMSCAGVCATAGSRAMWRGRVNAPALASIATKSIISHNGASMSTTAISPTTATARSAFVPRSTVSAGHRPAGRPTNGARMAGAR